MEPIDTICDECAEFVPLDETNDTDLGVLCNDCFAEKLLSEMIDENDHAIDA